MNRAITLFWIFAPIAIATILISGIRSRAHTPDSPEPLPQARVIVPAGTYLSLKIVAGIFESSKAGDTLQALSAEPVFVGSQLAVPENTRVGVHIDGIARHNRDTEDL